MSVFRQMSGYATTEKGAKSLGRWLRIVVDSEYKKTRFVTAYILVKTLLNFCTFSLLLLRSGNIIDQPV